MYILMYIVDIAVPISLTDIPIELPKSNICESRISFKPDTSF